MYEVRCLDVECVVSYVVCGLGVRDLLCVRIVVLCVVFKVCFCLSLCVVCLCLCQCGVGVVCGVCGVSYGVAYMCLESACTMKVRLVSCSVLCFAFVVCCRTACGVFSRAGKPTVLQFQRASVCTFQTPPCVPATRPHVLTWGRVSRIHAGVLNLHTEAY